jgi:hypothetical protein
MYQIRYRSAWLFGGLVSVLALTAVSIEMAHSRLPKQPAVFADLHVDASLLKMLASSPPEFEDDLQTHAELMTRSAVLNAALKRPEVAELGIVKRQDPNAIRWLARHIRVEPRGPKTLRILYAGEPSFDSAILINGIAAAYIDEILDVTSRLRGERIDELERAHCDVEHRLGEKREAISRLVKLLSSAEISPMPTEPSDRYPVSIWTRELENLKKAVIEGEEIDVRITAELATLKAPPRETGVGMIRMAEI